MLYLDDGGAVLLGQSAAGSVRQESLTYSRFVAYISVRDSAASAAESRTNI
ncbi:MAG TPA: hypothetical protein VFE62_13860 [Gemmataceae bacterium]|nr:hypothetical protein [Gemmataceae bacterium]